jgi:DNA-binding transcriptional MerR regulator
MALSQAERHARHREKKHQQRTMVSIGEAANILGLHIDTLREWDRAGKLIPQTTAGGHRRYLLSDLEKLVPKEGSTIKFKITSSGLSVPENFDLIETYQQLSEYSKAFAAGDIGFLLLVGSPGSGKSRQVKNDLHGHAVKWIDNHATNLGLYCAVYDAQDAPIVLDDVNHFISTKLSCSLIKSLTQTEDEKSVSWESTSQVLQDRNVPLSLRPNRQFA